MELIIAIVIGLLLLGLIFKFIKGAVKIVAALIVVVVIAWFVTSMGGTAP